MARLALLALLAPAPAMPAEVAPEVVKLRFAWPAGAEARVTYARERTRTGKEPVIGKASYVERSERRGEEVWMWASGAAVDVVDVPGASAADAAAMAAEVVEVSKGMARVVGHDGKFRRMEGLDQAIPALIEILGKRAPNAQAKEAVARMGPTLQAAGTAAAQTQWTYAVGQWAGEDLELGAAYEASTQAESPLAPGVPVTYRATFRVARRLACEGEAGPPRCVEILLRMEPDAADLPRIVEAMTRRFVAQAAPGTKLPEGSPFKEVGMLDEVRVVSDPATLQPRTVSWTRTVRVVVTDGKRESRNEQRDAKSWTYAWKGAGK